MEEGLQGNKGERKEEHERTKKKSTERGREWDKVME
jgi:hypothetical protein